MLHLVDRFVAFEFGQLLHAPMVEQAIMQPILVDRGQFVLERGIEEVDDLRIALHGDALRCFSASIIASEARAKQSKKWRISAVSGNCERYAAARSSSIMDRANGTHWPHLGWRPSER
jgi:hypothetical protein